MREQGIVEFFRLIQQTRPAKRAERAAAGYLPSRGLRYCDALTSATGYGYWVFPPLDIRLIWDGEQIFWSYGPDESWLPLSGTDSGAVQFPNYATAFDVTAPEFLRGYSPPFLTTLPELGGVQMWTGLLARTRPGWSLSVRSPVNLPPSPGVVTWEGIIETDLWFGPLFTNFRLTKTNTPVQVRSRSDPMCPASRYSQSRNWRIGKKPSARSNVAKLRTCRTLTGINWERCCFRIRIL